jgi:hypothetical protein
MARLEKPEAKALKLVLPATIVERESHAVKKTRRTARPAIRSSGKALKF